ncbi:MAG: phage tail protein [Acidobacteriota bacterium]
MATERDYPYSQFNFRVSWDGLGEETVQAGFQEVSGLGLEINVAEYRAGNSKENSPLKVSGSYKTPDVTLKRGVIGSLDLYQWLDAVRNGEPDQLKTITIKLMAEDRETVAQSWVLKGARPMKYTGPSFNGKGNEVAVEEMTFAAQRIEVQ